MISLDWVKAKVVTEKECEMTSINPIDHPKFFPDSMSPEARAAMPALKGLFTPKDPSEIILRDNF